MTQRGINASRLTRYLYEARMAFLFAILAAVVVVSAFGVRARAEMTCAADAIATGRAACAGSPAPSEDSGAQQSIRLIFQSAP